MKLRFGSVLDFSTVHYPGYISAVVFLAGCPLKCPYCFSYPLFERDSEKRVYGEEDVSYFLNHFRRIRKEVNAVVFTGGEPLQQANALIELCRELRKEGFLVRLETSGFFSEELHDILPFIDFVSMDLKTKLEPNEYSKVTGFGGDSSLLYGKIFKSLAFLENAQGVFKEFTTTVVPGLNDSPQVIQSISKEVSFADQYVLQQFTPFQGCLEKTFEAIPLTEKANLVELAKVAKNYVKRVFIKTIDSGNEETFV